MQNRARERIMDGLKALVGEGTAIEEMVPVQLRPPWALPAVFTAALVAVAIVMQLGIDWPLAPAIEGLVAAGVYVSVTKNFVLAKTAKGVVLAAAKMSGTATDIVDRDVTAAAVERSGSILTEKLTIGGQKYIASRALRSRLDAILGHTR